MAKMPEEMNNIAALISMSKIVEIFSDLIESADNASPEVQAFIEPFSNRVKEADVALRTLFGDDFLSK